jgi:hypothetical protein
MNAPPANERFQFGLRSLLIYTFGMAALISMLVCNTPLTIIPAWLLLAFFYCKMGKKECCIILCSAIGWFLLIMFLGGFFDSEEFFIFSCKVSGIVSMVAFHFFLFMR